MRDSLIGKDRSQSVMYSRSWELNLKKPANKCSEIPEWQNSGRIRPGGDWGGGNIRITTGGVDH
jgi:hypothetical protein